MLSNIAEAVRFHPDHLWVRSTDKAGEFTIGISHFAQKQLGNILFVELPRAGSHITGGEPFGAVESSKVVSDLVAPISGDVLEINSALRENPSLLNTDCYDAGWLAKLKTENCDIDNLLTLEAYLKSIGENPG